MKEKCWISEDPNLLTEKRDVLNDFLMSLKLANRSLGTIDVYRRCLQRALADFKQPLGEITSNDVKMWLDQFESNKSPRYLNAFMSMLSSFFTYCYNEGIVNKPLIKARWRVKTPQAKPRFLTQKEQAMMRLASEAMPLKERLIFEFLISTGCRRKELTLLNLNDLDIETHSARINGKGMKQRITNYSPHCAQILEKYLDVRTGDNPALFVNSKGKRITPEYLNQCIRKLGKEANLERRVSCHCLRHTFCTNMLNKGASMEVIRQMMGHSDDNVLRIYIGILNSDLREMYHQMM